MTFLALPLTFTEPTIYKAFAASHCALAFLDKALAVQAGGYSSPSVHGYGYGYSSPAATPLFGEPPRTYAS